MAAVMEQRRTDEQGTDEQGADQPRTDRRALSNEIPIDDDPDLTLLTVEAAIGWVNQKTGAERAMRFERVRALVNPR
jgi:hypothetical protein